LAGWSGDVDPDHSSVRRDRLRALGGELVGFPEPFDCRREAVQRPPDERVATSPQRRAEAALAVLESTQDTCGTAAFTTDAVDDRA
jgi:hypothetical protein